MGREKIRGCLFIFMHCYTHDVFTYFLIFRYTIAMTDRPSLSLLPLWIHWLHWHHHYHNNNAGDTSQDTSCIERCRSLSTGLWRQNSPKKPSLFKRYCLPEVDRPPDMNLPSGCLYRTLLSLMLSVVPSSVVCGSIFDNVWKSKRHYCIYYQTWSF